MKLRGVVKGKTIVLDSAAGLTEGMTVEVDVRDVNESDATANGPVREAKDKTFDTNELVNELREELGI